MAPTSILLTAAGGHIGSELIPLLIKAHPETKLVLPTSNATRLSAKHPPSEGNLAIEQGSLRNPQWLESIMRKHSVDAVFLCLTGTDELMTSLNFFDAMLRAGTVEHLVYLSACGDLISPQAVENVMKHYRAAHVIVKTTLEQHLARGGYPWSTTVLGPSLFMGNDERCTQSLLEKGFFTEPLGEVGVSRVHEGDIAAVAAQTLLHPEKWQGKKIMIGSLKRYTGAETCKIWSEALGGKEISMVPSTEEGFREIEDGFALLKNGGDLSKVEDDARAWGRDLRLMFEGFAVTGFGMEESDYRLLKEVLGREPRDYGEWVWETAKGWK
jgi:uncharacterized protein YbjT (DUF2867 family)